MRKLKEIGIGSFRPGDNSLNVGRHLSAPGVAGPSADADSYFSRRSQNPPNVVVDDFEEESDEEVILECRVYRNGKYCLLETLENLSEFSYADKFGSMMQKIAGQSRDRSQSVSSLPDAKDVVAQGIKKEDSELEDDSPLEEFSGAAAGGGGPAVPLGHTAKGKPETPAQRRKRQRFNITKSYPYNRLANPPRSRRKKRK